MKARDDKGIVDALKRLEAEAGVHAEWQDAETRTWVDTARVALFDAIDAWAERRHASLLETAKASLHLALAAEAYSDVDIPRALRHSVAGQRCADAAKVELQITGPSDPNQFLSNLREAGARMRALSGGDIRPEFLTTPPGPLALPAVDACGVTIPRNCRGEWQAAMDRCARGTGPMPYTLCPECAGDYPRRGSCALCGCRGWLTHMETIADAPNRGPDCPGRRPEGWCLACGDLAPAGSDSCGDRCPGRAR